MDNETPADERRSSEIQDKSWHSGTSSSGGAWQRTGDVSRGASSRKEHPGQIDARILATEEIAEVECSMARVRAGVQAGILVWNSSDEIWSHGRTSRDGTETAQCRRRANNANLHFLSIRTGMCLPCQSKLFCLSRCANHGLRGSTGGAQTTMLISVLCRWSEFSSTSASICLKNFSGFDKDKSFPSKRASVSGSLDASLLVVVSLSLSIMWAVARHLQLFDSTHL